MLISLITSISDFITGSYTDKWLTLVVLSMTEVVTRSGIQGFSGETWEEETT
jgi:hypothetical protein